MLSNGSVIPVVLEDVEEEQQEGQDEEEEG